MTGPTCAHSARTATWVCDACGEVGEFVDVRKAAADERARAEQAEAERDDLAEQVERARNAYAGECAKAATLRGELERVRGALEEFRVDDVALRGMEYESSEGGNMDCWTDPLIKANRVLRSLSAPRAEPVRDAEEVPEGDDDMEGRGPCGGTRCWKSKDGAWVHSSKSYMTCAVRRREMEPAPYAEERDTFQQPEPERMICASCRQPHPLCAPCPAPRPQQEAREEAWRAMVQSLTEYVVSYGHCVCEGPVECKACRGRRALALARNVEGT